MTTKLDIYNGALLLAGERFLSSLTENREPRRLLDRVWDSNGLKTCLEQGQWRFAMRTIQIDYDSSIEPGFGYNRGFEKPDDWVLTSGVCEDEFFRVPLLRYVDEAGYWYSDLDTIYVRYISDDENYGLDINKWPDSFREYVEEFFCSKIVRRLSNSESDEAASQARLRKKLKVAKSRAAMSDTTMFPARGEWAKSRNRFPMRRDGGNSNGPLIG